MDKRIAELNIEHFRRILETETDEDRCRQVRHLLREEEAKLREILAREQPRRERK